MVSPPRPIVSVLPPANVKPAVPLPLDLKYRPRSLALVSTVTARPLPADVPLKSTYLSAGTAAGGESPQAARLPIDVLELPTQVLDGVPTTFSA